MGLFTATLAAALVASPAELPTAPPPRPATDPEAAKHLAAWKKAADARENVAAAVTLTRAAGVFGEEVRSSGRFLALRPNQYRLRMAWDDDKNQEGYEAWICNGDSVFLYEGRPRTITEVALRPRPSAPRCLFSPYWFGDLVASSHPGEQVALLCLTGPDPERYHVSLVRAGRLSIDLDLEPRSEQDGLQFDRVRVRLTGPDAKTPYVPTGVRVTRRNREVEVWQFTDVQADVPGIAPKHFQFEPAPGFKHVKLRRPIEPER